VISDTSLFEFAFDSSFAGELNINLKRGDAQFGLWRWITCLPDPVYKMSWPKEAEVKIKISSET
jgi:hypothetical protein